MIEVWVENLYCSFLGWKIERERKCLCKTEMAESVMVRLEELGVGVWAGLGGRVTRWKYLLFHENVT